MREVLTIHFLMCVFSLSCRSDFEFILREGKTYCIRKDVGPTSTIELRCKIINQTLEYGDSIAIRVILTNTSNQRMRILVAPQLFYIWKSPVILGTSDKIYRKAGGFADLKEIELASDESHATTYVLDNYDGFLVDIPYQRYDVSKLIFSYKNSISKIDTLAYLTGYSYSKDTLLIQFKDY